MKIAIFLALIFHPREIDLVAYRGQAFPVTTHRAEGDLRLLNLLKKATRGTSRTDTLIRKLSISRWSGLHWARGSSNNTHLGWDRC